MKLTIELVPKTCFFSNVRSEISATLWDILRKETYRKANYRCEICNGKGEKWPANYQVLSLQNIIHCLSIQPILPVYWNM